MPDDPGREIEQQKAIYDFGIVIGGINGRLAAHDSHFAGINGSISALAAETRTLAMQMQRLGDGIESNAKFMIESRNDRESITRAANEKTNRRIMIWGLLISAVVIIVNIIIAVLLNVH